MVKATCFIHENQISSEDIALLTSELGYFTQKAFGMPVDVTWITVPKNSGYTVGKLSTTIIITIQSNEILAQPKRVMLLKELCDIWVGELGMSTNEIVGIITDPPN